MEEYKYSISKEEINQYDLGAYEDEIVLIEDLEKAVECIKELGKTSYLGFDTESKPSFRKGEHHPISLIQISSENKAYLFRLNKIESVPDFSSVFSDAKIVKIGLGIRDELKELEKKLGIECNGFVDLEKIAKYHQFHQRGLRALAAFFLNIRISKTAQKSNWERSELTEQQLRYAATDAWACLKIYNTMIKDKFLPLENSEDMYVDLRNDEKKNDKEPKKDHSRVT